MYASARQRETEEGEPSVSLEPEKAERLALTLLHPLSHNRNTSSIRIAIYEKSLYCSRGLLKASRINIHQEEQKQERR